MTPMSTCLSNLRPAALLAAGLMCAGLAGCMSTSQEREAYFDSRTTAVQAQPGTGAARVAVWPAGNLGKSTIAAANRRSVSDAPTR